jgi:glycosyltransferase involved in cell wall biosynthesis
MGKKSNGICVVSFPISMPFTIPLSNLTRILSGLYGEIDVIVGAYEGIRLVKGERIRYHEYIHKSSGNTIVKVIRYAWLQAVMTVLMIRGTRKCDTVIFFMELGPFLPLAAARLMGKRTLWMLPSSFLKMSEKGRSYPKLLKKLHPLNYALSDSIVVYSKNIICEWGLENYQRKIKIANEHFIDTLKFSVKKSPNDRGRTIGFLGRLSEEKGILNFIYAVPLILKEIPDCQFTIIGDGPLRNDIDRFITTNNLINNVQCKGWIPHDALPEYLNKLRIIIIPSDTEGLPNAMVEAMACGAVIVASPVGAIPDIIGDGKNGYLLPDNSPKMISRIVANAIFNGDLDRIAADARKTVESRFVYESCMKSFEKIF